MNGLQLLAVAASAAGTTALLIALLLRRGPRFALDQPNRRSLHSTAVPRTGGLALLGGVAASAVLVSWGIPSAVLYAGAALAAVSLVDDLRNLPVGARLACHFAAAAIAAVAILAPAAGPLVLGGAILATAWMINLYNFMDGSDGMAGGMAVAGFGAYAALALAGGDAGLAALCIAVAASAAAFLAFNFQPARIFLGDSGSVPLGFLAAALGLLGTARGLWTPWAALLTFSPFIADATLTLARRVLSRERFWEAHHDHGYQRLIRMGWSHRATALAAYGLMLGGALLAVALRGVPESTQAAAAGGWYLLLAALLGAIELRWRRR